MDRNGWHDMRVVDQAPRVPETVRQEIEDLQSYLLGLPSEWRESGSFLAYEERLRALDHELALGRIAEFASNLSVARMGGGGLEVSGFAEVQARVIAILKDSERQYAQLAEARARESRWLGYATLLASSATVASTLASASLFILPVALTAVGTAAAMAFFRLSDRSREAAKRADYLMALRNEVALFPEGSEFASFETSARVEALISSVLTTEVGERPDNSGT